MKPCRWSALAIIFFFCFSVLAPVPLAAMDEQRKGSRFESFKEFWKNDWNQTKKDFISIRLTLYKLRKDLFSRGRSSWGTSFEKLKGNLLEKASTTINEIGPREFQRMVFEATGQQVLGDIDEDSNKQMLSAKMINEIGHTFDVVATDIINGSKSDLEEVLNNTESIITSLRKGDSQEEVGANLRKKVDKKSSPKKFFKTAYKVLMAVFMAASVGAISLVSLGFLSAAIAGGSIVFTALGGAMTIACIVGIVKYVKEGIAAIKYNLAVPAEVMPAAPVEAVFGAPVISASFTTSFPMVTVPLNFQFNLGGAY